MLHFLPPVQIKLPVTYAGVIDQVSQVIAVREAARAARIRKDKDKVRSLQDCMYEMHCAWQGLNDEIRQTKLICEKTGCSHLDPVLLAANILMAETAMFILELGFYPPVMTPIQATANRGRQTDSRESLE